MALLSRNKAGLSISDRKKVLAMGAGVFLQKPDGNTSYFYEASADTNAARGTAMLTANAASEAGDLLQLGCGSYLQNTAGADTAMELAGVSLRGMGKRATFIERTTEGELVYAESGTISIADVMIDQQDTVGGTEALLVQNGATLTLYDTVLKAAGGAATLWLQAQSTAVAQGCEFYGSLRTNSGSNLKMQGCLLEGPSGGISSAIADTLGAYFEAIGCVFRCASGSVMTCPTNTAGTATNRLISCLLELTGGTGSCLTGSSAATLRDCHLIAPTNTYGARAINNFANYTFYGGSITGAGTHLSRSLGTITIDQNLRYDPTLISGTITYLLGHYFGTTTQRDAVPTPPTGMTWGNTTTGKLNVRGASAWEVVTSS